MYFFLVSTRNLRTVLELFMCTKKFLLSYRLHTGFWLMSVMIMHSQSFLRSSIISRRCSLIFSSYPFIDSFLSVSIFFILVFNISTFKGISNFSVHFIFGLQCVGVLLSNFDNFDSKSLISFCLVLLTDFGRLWNMLD